MLPNGRLKAILILFAGVAFVALGVYQALVPDAWGGGGEWVTDDEGNSKYVIMGEGVTDQDNEKIEPTKDFIIQELVDENRRIVADNIELRKQITDLMEIVMEQLRVISQLAGLDTQ